MRAPALPEGFVTSSHRNVTLVSDVHCTDALVRAGLDDPSGWRRRLASGNRRRQQEGRGATARVELTPACVARIKQLRRGGWLAPLWRDRFAGTHRVLENLRLPVEAARSGIATPAPLALLIERGLPGLVRAWLAVEEIDDATDLRECFVSGRPPEPGELDAVLRLVRTMHERGLEHRDLNLGNLLLRRSGEPAAWVVDLDGARLHLGPLPFTTRQRALRRLERSYVKTCHPRPAGDSVRRSIYTSYAAGDSALERRLARGRRAGRVWIQLHRLGWRGK